MLNAEAAVRAPCRPCSEREIEMDTRMRKGLEMDVEMEQV
jgi:hypothetical protein